MKKIVLYGAGNLGKSLYAFLRKQNLGDYIWGFCDEQAKKIGYIADKKVWTYEELAGRDDILYVITPHSQTIKNEIKEKLKLKQCMELSELQDYLPPIDRVKFEREFCRYYHVYGMDDYFERAEDTLQTFWNENTVFYQMFQKLDLTDVIELACGRGRHVTQYTERSGTITLVDILQENIDFCRERFRDLDNIYYYKNDGYDLKGLKDAQYTALFTYDAMVHFELIDIYSYLKETCRVLKSGGRALFHHSNNGKDYRASFMSGEEGRSFMNREVFAYLADRAGFTVLEQKVIDWGLHEGLDCVTLVEKEH